MNRSIKTIVWCSAAAMALAWNLPAIAAEKPAAVAASALNTQYITIPFSRSTLVTLGVPMTEVMVANPDIADVHAHNATNLTVVGKKLGRTSVRMFDKDGALLKELDVTVGYDLPAIRRALKNFLPNETIGVEMVNSSVALTGQVSGAQAAETAVRIAKEFVGSAALGLAPKDRDSKMDALKDGDPEILNMLSLTSGQQVMLRVRVGEINREALKNLGIDLNYITRTSGTSVLFGTGSGIAGLATGTGGTITNPGTFTLPGGIPPTGIRGVLGGRWQPDGAGGESLGGLIKALERDGLFKLLAEPNLVAISGEQAEFLAGGEIPIPVVQQGNLTSNNITIEWKPFGVAVKFTPSVLSENRIRVAVMPEVSEISTENALLVSGFSIPSISTRRTKTTVELAPGESFMIAGLIKDQMRATIDQVPGAKELPVLGALLRSNEFKRNETELVIAVTPYLVDPAKSSDIKLPTDNFRPASAMEGFFYGMLGGISPTNGTYKAQRLEGPVGFMVD